MIKNIPMERKEQVKRCEELIDRTRARIISRMEDRAPEYWGEKELRQYIAENFAILAFIPLGCERSRKYRDSKTEHKL